MAQVKILNKNEIQSILDMKSVVEAVEKAYEYKCSERAELFPIVCHSFEDGWSELDIKSGSVDGAGIFGLKLVSAFARNSDKGLPRLTGTILIFDRETGILRSIMDGGCITNMRTGAAGAVGCKYLARPEAENVLLVGTGAQGSTLIAATLEVMKNIKKIYVCNPHSYAKAEEFCTQISDEEITTRGVSLIPAANLESACAEADIILTATPSREPLIMKEWVKAGTHFSCIGSDMEGKQELDTAIMGMANVFCDDSAQVIAVGECEKAVKAGILKCERITEIGDVILGKAAGRKTGDEITVFDSTGIAVQDLITAAIVTDIADKKGLGMTVEL